ERERETCTLTDTERGTEIHYSIDKTEVLVLGPHTARSNLSDHTVTLDGLSVSSFAAVKDLGVILTPVYDLMLM
ncbi:hypothetical protein ACU6QO_00275, partial [Aeromonas veronii]|uniref:hypothetical protein n=1 Tax=Aeromonas veronii TaxID=654 RepID=UPI00406BF0A0